MQRLHKAHGKNGNDKASRAGEQDARDDGRESVSRKAREVEPATVERNTHMVEVPLSNASTMSGSVEETR